MAVLINVFPLGCALLLVGALIGSIGIGGVLLVPSLMYLGNVDVHIAIATSSFSYLFSGAAGGLLYLRKGVIKWPMAGALVAGAMPGAFLGAATMASTPAVVLELVIAALIGIAGVHALIQDAEHGCAVEFFGNRKLFAIGFAVGYGSAASGTGGPLILVPILLWLGTPVLTAIGLSQVIQVPIAILASVGNVVNEKIDFMLGAWISIFLVAGIVIGARFTSRLSPLFLKKAAAALLIGSGALVVSLVGHRYLLTGHLG